MCAILLKPHREQRHGRLYRISEWFFDASLAVYEWTLRRVLMHQRITLVVTLSTIGFTVYLYTIIPTGFFPQQDTGRLMGNLQADQDASFQSISQLLQRYSAVVSADPAVEAVVLARRTHGRKKLLPRRVADCTRTP